MTYDLHWLDDLDIWVIAVHNECGCALLLGRVGGWRMAFLQHTEDGVSFVS